MMGDLLNTLRALTAARWLAVLPGAALAAVAALFPIHWVVLYIGYSGTETDSSGDVSFSNPISAIPAEVLEYFANAFFVPLIFISVGSLIAPKFKLQTGAALAIALAFVYGTAVLAVIDDIQDGLYTPSRWLRLGITLVLCVAGFAAGLVQAAKVARRTSEQEVA